MHRSALRKAEVGLEEGLTLAGEAAAGLLRYLGTDVPGLWYDRLTPAGDLPRETVTAGNLYHIVGAIRELASLVRFQGH